MDLPLWMTRRQATRIERGLTVCGFKDVVLNGFGALNAIGVAATDIASGRRYMAIALSHGEVHDIPLKLLKARGRA